MLKYLKKMLSGKRKRRYYNNNLNYHYRISDNEKQIQELNNKMYNLMQHLKVTTIGSSRVVIDEKDKKKFKHQY